MNRSQKLIFLLNLILIKRSSGRLAPWQDFDQDEDQEVCVTVFVQLNTEPR
jgi:hypothetical protein